MTWLHRIVALFLAFLIIIVTPITIWALNLRRVGFDPQTYKSALNDQDLYNNLMPVLIESAARSQSDATFKALTKNLSTTDLGTVATTVLPASWLKDQIDANIDRLFTWLNDSSPVPDIKFDLTELKQKLSDKDSARAAVTALLPSLPPCKADETTSILNIASGKDSTKFPICNPSSDDLRTISTTTVAGFLTTAAQKLPDSWGLDQSILLLPPGNPTPNGTGLRGPGNANRLSANDIIRFRAGLWLVSRLVLLLLLIPIVLLSMIVIVAVRSGRSFFRWTGAILLISGLITLLPVLVFPFRLAAQFRGAETGFDQSLGASAPLLGQLLYGVFASIDTQLTLSALITAAAVILVGLFAILLSIFWPEPEPTVERWQVMLEQSGMTPAMTFPNMAPNPGPVPTVGINDQPTMH